MRFPVPGPGRPAALGALLAAFVCVLPAFAAAEGEATYSDRFFGISWEFAGTPPAAGVAESRLEPRELSLLVAVGDRRIFPYPALRLRGGLGWWPGNPLVGTLGCEVAVLEFLNRTQSRLTGLYLRADLTLGYGPDGFAASARPSAVVLVPANALGGVALGAGWDTRLGPCLTLCYLTGTYLMNRSHPSRDE